MSSLWVGIGMGVATLASGALAAESNRDAARDASRISGQSSAAQLAFLRQQSNQARQDLLPYAAGGRTAFGEFLKQLGLDTSGVTNEPNSIDVASGRGTYGSRLIALPGVSTVSTHSPQTNQGGLAQLIKPPTDLDPTPPALRSTTRSGGSGPRLFYDPGSHTIVDGDGQLIANVPESGRIGGLLNGFNNPVEVRGGRLYGIGSRRENDLNLQLSPLTPEQRKAYEDAGKAPATTASEGRYGAFFESPGYKFLYDEAMRGARANGAARGSLYSGAMLKELQNRATGLASQDYGNYMTRLAGAANLGQASAAGQAANANSLGANSVTVMGNSASDRANAALISGASTASAISGANTALQGTLGSLLDYYKNRPPVPDSATTGRSPAVWNPGWQGP